MNVFLPKSSGALSEIPLMNGECLRVHDDAAAGDEKIIIRQLDFFDGGAQPSKGLRRALQRGRSLRR